MYLQAGVQSDTLASAAVGVTNGEAAGFISFKTELCVVHLKSIISHVAPRWPARALNFRTHTRM